MLVELDRPGGSAGAAGEELELLVLHMGMTGRLGLAEPESALPPHTHLRLLLSSGAELRMQDYRRFGRVMLGTPDELAAARAMPTLGPEPATDAEPNPESWRSFAGGLSEREFHRILRAARRPVKALLLDQRLPCIDRRGVRDGGPNALTTTAPHPPAVEPDSGMSYITERSWLGFTPTARPTFSISAGEIVPPSA